MSLLLQPVCTRVLPVFTPKVLFVALVHTRWNRIDLSSRAPLMPIDETKNVRIVFVVSHETRRDLDALAKKDRRPLGAYLRNLCEDHVKETKENG